MGDSWLAELVAVRRRLPVLGVCKTVCHGQLSGHQGLAGFLHQVWIAGKCVNNPAIKLRWLCQRHEAIGVFASVLQNNFGSFCELSSQPQ